jgi:hypothetical protein
LTQKAAILALDRTTGLSHARQAQEGATELQENRRQ